MSMMLEGTITFYLLTSGHCSIQPEPLSKHRVMDSCPMWNRPRRESDISILDPHFYTLPSRQHPPTSQSHACHHPSQHPQLASAARQAISLFVHRDPSSVFCPSILPSAIHSAIVLNQYLFAESNYDALPVINASTGIALYYSPRALSTSGTV